VPLQISVVERLGLVGADKIGEKFKIVVVLGDINAKFDTEVTGDFNIHVGKPDNTSVTNF
jgi:hypothetical protein